MMPCHAILAEMKTKSSGKSLSREKDSSILIAFSAILQAIKMIQRSCLIDKVTTQLVNFIDKEPIADIVDLSILTIIYLLFISFFNASQCNTIDDGNIAFGFMRLQNRTREYDDICLCLDFMCLVRYNIDIISFLN
ncbi:hypothetical protein BpHYR1_008466 [Brachionus plicatilis]|uniref:Uncharacterized protein n=1 Tax=Brachionus plicatilis TaxID=10195 RepID=A0A3M7S9W1_BRAPC|nr:hypothetical protein BpHYR1_008466 [Brachionus plicatilis]